MTPDEKKKLQHIVERYAELNGDIKTAREEQKELADSAWEACGIKPKVVKQLAKEKDWTEVERMERRQFEESLDDCRAALGMLLDTPLGDAAEKQHAEHKVRYKGKRNGKGKPQQQQAAL